MGNGSRGLKLDLGHKHRKNGSVTFPDFDEAGPRKNDSTWLSSDCTSPSMLSFVDDDGGNGWRDPLPFLFATDGYSKEEQDSDAKSGVCSSESGDSCFTRSLCESSCTTLGTQEDSADIWVSSLDLDVEDSEFVQAREQWSNIFGSDFPSPSVRSNKQAPLQFSPDCDPNEEALFWPFDPKSYVLRDFEKNFLCLSPRKDLRNVGDEGLSTYRKITISPPSTPAAGGFKTRDHPNKKKSNQKYTGTTTPSRLGRSHRPSPDKYYHDCAISRSEPLLDLEMDICQSFVAAQGAAIETLVGLSEFDGHEGIGIGCGGDDSELVLD